MAFNNLRSKLNRAVAAYLVSAGAGTAATVLPANTRAAKGYPNTTVKSTIAAISDSPYSGNRRITLHIDIRGTATQDPEEVNEDLARKAFDARLSETYDAMMQTDDGGRSLGATSDLVTAAGRALAVASDGSDAEVLKAANNADMADFTCGMIEPGGEGDGDPDAVGCSWREILIFYVRCSPSNVD